MIKESFELMSESLFDLEDEEKIELNETYTTLFRGRVPSELEAENMFLKLYTTLSDGFTLEWIADQKNDIRGKIKLLKIEEIIGDWKGVIYFESDLETEARICNYHPFDFFAEEASCGFYFNPETKEASKEIYYNYAGEREMQGLDLDFAGYFEMLLEAKAFFYWPKVLLDIQHGTECVETRRFKESMPELFEEFSFEEFAAEYESLRLSKQ